jgi:hypothetical protein
LFARNVACVALILQERGGADLKTGGVASLFLEKIEGMLKEEG